MRDKMSVRHYGGKGIPLVECINPRLWKYRVRWDVQAHTDGRGNEMVSFVEAEFLYKPQAEDVERVVADSGVDAAESELEAIGVLLGYEKESFALRMAEGREARIASDPQAQLMEIVREQHLADPAVEDARALRVPATFFTFEELCRRGKELEAGVALRYDNKLWRVVQRHTPQGIYPPSMATAALYTRIEPGHAGTPDAPIPYEQGMAFERGKYYSQYGVVYECILTTQTGYPNDLKDLPTIVKKVEG